MRTARMVAHAGDRLARLVEAAAERLGILDFGCGDLAAVVLADAFTEPPRSAIGFVVLRLEGSSKITARLARRDTVVGGTKIAAGTKIAIALAVISRDPRRWDDPNHFILNRPRIKEHLSFGRGAHTCAGAPLARVEVRVLMEKFFKYAAHIDLDETIHGAPDARRFVFEPSFIVRGLSTLTVKLTPVDVSQSIT